MVGYFINKYNNTIHSSINENIISSIDKDLPTNVINNITDFIQG